MMEREKWSFKSTRNVIEVHASEYDSPLDAFYEYIKNLEEALARTIRIEFDYKARTILVYGDSRGMGALELDRIRSELGESIKGHSHHGLGILSFLRFSKRMSIFSKKDDNFYVLTAMAEDDDIWADTGKAHEVSDRESGYRGIYSKLNHWHGGGTLTVLEGVGQYESKKLRYAFDMADVFSYKNVHPWLKDKLHFSQKQRDYFIRYGAGEKFKKFEAKVGHGRRVEFTVPSKDYPVDDIPGTQKNTFIQNGAMYRIEMEGDFCFSLGNNGKILISNDRQNALEIKDAIRGPRLSSSTAYKNSEYLKFLQGFIDFKIKPCDKAGDVNSLNLYTGARQAIITDNEFGNAMINMLTYIDTDIIKPQLMKLAEKSVNRKEELRSKKLQADMEAFFTRFRDYFKNILHTHSIDPVSNNNYVICPRCRFEKIPTRGHRSEIKIEAGHIYAFDEADYYVCGNCGNRWERKRYGPRTEGGGGTGEPRKKPLYLAPDPGEDKPRHKRHGFGYIYKIVQMKRDPRRAYVVGTEILINSAHPDYRKIEKIHVVRALYERQMAIQAVIRTEMADQPKKALQVVEDSLVFMLSYSTSKNDGDNFEEPEVLESRAQPVKAMPDEKKQKNEALNKLGDKWGARVRMEPVTIR